MRAAELFEQIGDHRAAAGALERYLLAYPDELAAHLLLGTVEAGLEHDPQARAAFSKCTSYAKCRLGLAELEFAKFARRPTRAGQHAVEKAYSSVFGDGAREEESAAAYRIGESYERLARAIPGDKNLLALAGAAYKMALAEAKRANVENRWTEHARSALERLGGAP